MRCDECGRGAGAKAAGWFAVRLDVPDDPDPPELAIFCRVCVEREFRDGLPPDAKPLSGE
jgi:hypothetical protein